VFILLFSHLFFDEKRGKSRLLFDHNKHTWYASQSGPKHKWLILSTHLGRFKGNLARRKVSIAALLASSEVCVQYPSSYLGRLSTQVLLNFAPRYGHPFCGTQERDEMKNENTKTAEQHA
jgi:hypothetical protein